MTNDVLRLAAELMAIDSTSGQEGELMAHVSLMLESRGWRVTRIPVTPGRMNVFATCVHDAARHALDASRHRAAVHSAAHRWTTRSGAAAPATRKGIAASMILAAEQLRERECPVALLFVVGEEIVARWRACRERATRHQPRAHRWRAHRIEARARNQGRDARHHSHQRRRRALGLSRARRLRHHEARHAAARAAAARAAAR